MITLNRLSDELQCALLFLMYAVTIAITEEVILCTVILLQCFYISYRLDKLKKRIKSYQKFCAKISQKSLDKKYLPWYNISVKRIDNRPHTDVICAFFPLRTSHIYRDSTIGSADKACIFPYQLQSQLQCSLTDAGSSPAPCSKAVLKFKRKTLVTAKTLSRK